jgi:hypothetical protein
VQPDARLVAEVSTLPYRFVYATLTGEHLYGMAAPDSDYDVRAMHVLPARAVAGLRAPPETVAHTGHRQGLDFEFVSHEMRSVCLMLLKKNGNVLEQIFSPLVVHTTPEHEELKEIALLCANTHMAYHFLSHARMQWSVFEERRPLRVKGLLYSLRVLLTGIHLLRTGEVEASLLQLHEVFELDYVPDLVERRREEGEDARLRRDETGFLRAEYERLRDELERAERQSALPPLAPDAARERLDELLVRLRLDPR